MTNVAKSCKVRRLWRTMIAYLLEVHCTQKKEISTNRNISEFLYCKTILVKMTLYRYCERISGDVPVNMLTCTEKYFEIAILLQECL